MEDINIGSRCVACDKSTAPGSGKFVNRIPADADWELRDSRGNVVYAEGVRRIGYMCEECYADTHYLSDSVDGRDINYLD